MEETKTNVPRGGTPKPAPEARSTRSSPNNRRPTARFQAQRVPRLCPFCEQKAKTIDYKNVDMLRHYLTDHAKIKPRRKVGTCAKHQRMLASAIKRARHVALLPFVTQSLRGE